MSIVTYRGYDRWHRPYQVLLAISDGPSSDDFVQLQAAGAALAEEPTWFGWHVVGTFDVVAELRWAGGREVPVGPDTAAPLMPNRAVTVAAWLECNTNVVQRVGILPGDPSGTQAES